jgi:hypothetical protein
MSATAAAEVASAADPEAPAADRPAIATTENVTDAVIPSVVTVLLAHRTFACEEDSTSTTHPSVREAARPASTI